MEEPEKPTPKSRASVDVDKGAKSPFSFKGYELGQKVTLNLRGKVISVRQDEYGSRLEIELTGPEGKGSITEDMKAMKEKHKV